MRMPPKQGIGMVSREERAMSKVAGFACLGEDNGVACSAGGKSKSIEGKCS